MEDIRLSLIYLEYELHLPPRKGGSTAFLIDGGTKMALTSFHGVANLEQINPRTVSGEPLEIKVEAGFPDADLALLSVSKGLENLQPLTLADEHSVIERGTEVEVAGFPLQARFGCTVRTTKYMGTDTSPFEKSRAFDAPGCHTWPEPRGPRLWLEPCGFTSGFSGGPVRTLDHNVIGVMVRGGNWLTASRQYKKLPPWLQQWLVKVATAGLIAQTPSAIHEVLRRYENANRLGISLNEFCSRSHRRREEILSLARQGFIEAMLRPVPNSRHWDWVMVPNSQFLTMT